jgi:hypothetical protein
MYCPRCGTAVTETTKYCKGCGLPMAQLYAYVTSGGTSALTPPPQEVPAGALTYRQQKILTILAFVFAPALLPIIASPVSGDLAGWLAGIAAVLMPLGIVWANFYFNAKIRRQEATTAAPPRVPPPRPLAAPPPVYQPPQPLPPHRTNPLGEVPRRPAGSVVEDETRRLPEK